MDLMREEWEAWQEVVKEFGKVVGDIDSPRFKPLVSSIQVWGEMLHKLRATGLRCRLRFDTRSRVGFDDVTLDQA